MAMSDCIKCWDTPCSCGWDYKNYSEERLSKFIANITQYRTKDEAKGIIIDAIGIVNDMDNWYGEDKAKNAGKS